jgi:hypothetical protein
MPYKVFVAGEEALAADANSFLMSQTVPRFTNAAQRTSQLTAPVLNQLSMRDDRPGAIERWTGSAWEDPSAARTVAGLFSAGYTIPPAASSAVFPMTIAIPVPGYLVVQGVAHVKTLSGTGPQLLDIHFMQASGGPALASGQTGWISGTTQIPECMVPLFATYPVQPKGNVALAIQAASAAGGVTCQLVDVSLVVHIQPV